ncbi:hypothetical protein ABB02_02088 [Clostridiaceae bacterium JG1575]|nr:hypothetical protein ABB02_02088 [Clostridiaceae bacterium JG1575]
MICLNHFRRASLRNRVVSFFEADPMNIMGVLSVILFLLTAKNLLMPKQTGISLSMTLDGLWNVFKYGSSMLFSTVSLAAIPACIFINYLNKSSAHVLHTRPVHFKQILHANVRWTLQGLFLLTFLGALVIFSKYESSLGYLLLYAFSYTLIFIFLCFLLISVSFGIRLFLYRTHRFNLLQNLLPIAIANALWGALNMLLNKAYRAYSLPSGVWTLMIAIPIVLFYGVAPEPLDVVSMDPKKRTMLRQMNSLPGSFWSNVLSLISFNHSLFIEFLVCVFGLIVLMSTINFVQVSVLEWTQISVMLFIIPSGLLAYYSDWFRLRAKEQKTKTKLLLYAVEMSLAILFILAIALFSGGPFQGLGILSLILSLFVCHIVQFFLELKISSKGEEAILFFMVYGFLSYGLFYLFMKAGAALM